MACSKYTLTNTGSTTTYFNYRRCDDSMWEYQVSLEPNQTRNIWLINGSYSTPYTTIVRTSSSAFPPSTESITIELTAGFFSGSIGAGFSAISNLPVNGQVEVSFVCTLGTTTGDSIDITSAVTIPVNQTEGFTQLFIDGDYAELDGTASFSSVTYSTTGVSVNVSSTFTGATFDVTPTPSNTSGPIPPTPTPTTSETPTPTPTPTYTPTPSVTPAPAFISIWSGSSVSLPLESSGTYDFYVNWGDGNIDQITAWDQAETTHVYDTESTYTITINGTIDGWSFSGGGDASKILEIGQWGPLKLGNTGNYFDGCNNLILDNLTDVLDLSSTTNLTGIFKDCSSIVYIPNVYSWDTSNVTNLDEAFYGCLSFDESGVGSWDTSNVTSMNNMFNTTTFNNTIGYWVVSAVTSMVGMFANSQFSQDIELWDVSNVTDMSNMFQNSSFNQLLNGWDVSNVTNMSHMFDNSVFDQQLSGWNVSNVTDMSYMFATTNFNKDISSWNVSGVTYFQFMFFNDYSFNQPIGVWDVQNAQNFNSMLKDCTAFDQPLSGWSVGSVQDMTDFMGGKTSADYSPENVSTMLCSWSGLTLQLGVTLGLGIINLPDSAQICKDSIINDYGWTINYGTDIFEFSLTSGATDLDACTGVTTSTYWSDVSDLLQVNSMIYLDSYLSISAPTSFYADLVNGKSIEYDTSTGVVAWTNC